MTVLNLEQYRSAVKLCERLLDNNSTVRPSDTSLLGFHIEYEALARYVRACFRLGYDKHFIASAYADNEGGGVEFGESVLVVPISLYMLCVSVMVMVC